MDDGLGDLVDLRGKQLVLSICVADEVARTYHLMSPYVTVRYVDVGRITMPSLENLSHD